MSKVAIILTIAVVGAAGLILIPPQVAKAECTYKGQVYPEGTVIRGRVCRKGRWQ
jgi:hypothetical protein